MSSMLPDEWLARLDAVQPEVLHRAASGAALSAVVLLGEVFVMAAPTTRNRALREVRARVTEDVLLRASVEADRALKRILHVVSIGSTFNTDEIILLLTLRFEVELASPLLDQPFDLHRIDEELRGLARSAENHRSFAAALSTIRRNWRVPIEDRWSR